MILPVISLNLNLYKRSPWCQFGLIDLSVFVLKSSYDLDLDSVGLSLFHLFFPSVMFELILLGLLHI